MKKMRKEEKKINVEREEFLKLHKLNIIMVLNHNIMV